MRSRRPQVRTAIACLGIIAAAASLLAMAPAQAQRTGRAPAGGSPHVIMTIPVNREPINIAVDPVTGMIYASDSSQRSVLAIDGKTSTVTAQIKLGGFGFWIATDPATDRIYTEAATSPGVEHVAVIDGRTNTLIARIPTHSIFVEGIAVNPVTNMIYAAAGSPDSLLVISGQTNKVTATVDTSPFYAATDPVTNTIYATELGESSSLVDVVNGQTNTLSTVIPGGSPEGIATDPSTDFVYTADFYGDNVRVINGQTSKVAAKVGVGHNPQGVAADPRANRIYVANTGSRSVSVLAGAG